jgi:ribosomal protein L6P/L9E
MSRIGKQLIVIPEGVKIEQKGLTIKVSGPLGSLLMNCHSEIAVKIDNSGGKIKMENSFSR